MKLFFAISAVCCLSNLSASKAIGLTKQQQVLYDVLKKASSEKDLSGEDWSLPATWRSGNCKKAVINQDLLEALITYFNKNNIEQLNFEGVSFRCIPDFHRSTCTVLNCAGSSIGAFLNTYKYNQNTKEVSYPGLFPVKLKNLSLAESGLKQLNIALLPTFNFRQLQISGNLELSCATVFNAPYRRKKRSILVRASLTGLTRDDIQRCFGLQKIDGSEVMLLSIALRNLPTAKEYILKQHKKLAASQDKTGDSQ